MKTIRVYISGGESRSRQHYKAKTYTKNELIKELRHDYPDLDIQMTKNGDYLVSEGEPSESAIKANRNAKVINSIEFYRILDNTSKSSSSAFNKDSRKYIDVSDDDDEYDNQQYKVPKKKTNPHKFNKEKYIADNDDDLYNRYMADKYDKDKNRYEKNETNER